MDSDFDGIIIYKYKYKELPKMLNWKYLELEI